MKQRAHSSLRLTGRVLLCLLLVGVFPSTPAPQSLKPLNTPIHPTDSTPNRLAREKSPYLLQHQFNPVDWYPWGEEAFQRASKENKPLFLSIGYSTCHWCHVMERESFENEEIARFLNEHFISIKVDREERPDIDKIYMTYVQATTGRGGWPMTVFLTPDRQPFFGGTYFPPQGQAGHPGFLQVLNHIHEIWTTRREEVLLSASDITRKLADHVNRQASEKGEVTDADLANATTLFMDEYDPTFGGFGGAPKFPRPSQPSFLLRYGARTQNRKAVEMVLHTCRQMAAGGINDHIGGGFARYSVDAQWLVPHFEKMLYDNAQLVHLFLDASLISGEPSYADVARDIVRYVLRDMTHSDGGFFSAEDADSEGKEGKFYCWTHQELAELLTPDELAITVEYFGITEKGNFVDHSDPDPLLHQNVLSIVSPRLKPGQEKHLESARTKMFTARQQRVRPHLDDKVLASWNGLMLGAIARLYGVTGEAPYLEAASRNLEFLRTHLWNEATGSLSHRWREGECDTVQLLTAYAFLLDGVLYCYQATLEPSHLSFAIQLADAMLERFYDPDAGGFWQSVPDGTQIMRVKDDYDGAEPSGNSAALLGLIRLHEMTGNPRYRDAVDKTLALFAPRLKELPQAVPLMLESAAWLATESQRVVIAGNPEDRNTQAMVRAAHNVFTPHQVILGNTGPVDAFAANLPANEGAPTAYVCTGSTCKPPTDDVAELKNLLGH